MGKGKTSGPPPSSSLDDDDRRLFERELVGVRPLRPGPERVTATPAAANGTHLPIAKAQPREAAIVLAREGTRVSGAAFGVSNATLRELAAGPAEAACDLHGLRAEAAGLRLRAFIAEARTRGRRVVTVVCGRGRHSGPGGPVLLEVACEALAHSPVSRHVQAFVSAAPKQGGEGALMVLLRHRER